MTLCGLPCTSIRRTAPKSGHLGVGPPTPCCSDSSVIFLKLDISKTGHLMPVPNKSVHCVEGYAGY